MNAELFYLPLRSVNPQASPSLKTNVTFQYHNWSQTSECKSKQETLLLAFSMKNPSNAALKYYLKKLFCQSSNILKMCFKMPTVKLPTRYRVLNTSEHIWTYLKVPEGLCYKNTKSAYNISDNPGYSSFKMLQIREILHLCLPKQRMKKWHWRIL